MVSTFSAGSAASVLSELSGWNIRNYGQDLSTLTLGRIADGFRRDRFTFPVDLQGRGEGRAVEARAVMQVKIYM